MKTPKHALSGNPFVNVFRSLAANLQKKETVKRAWLASFVLLCILIRLSILSADKNLVKQNKRVSFSAENLNQPVWPTGMKFRNEAKMKQYLIQPKAQHKSFGRDKKSLD